MPRAKRSASAAAASPPKRKSRKKNKNEADVVEPPPPAENHSDNNDTEPNDESAPGVANPKSNPENADSPLLVFAHGAGANSSHEWMVR